MENFKQSGVTVRTGVRVVEVTPTEVVLGSGERIPQGLVVWSVGNAPRNLVTDLATAIPEQKEHLPGGRLTKLAVDPFLRVIGAEDVLAVGDCSYIVDMPLPPTAQVAGQQGAYAAHVVNRGYRLGRGGFFTVPPYKSEKDSLSIADRVFASIDTFGNNNNSGSMGSIDLEERQPVLVLKKPFDFLSLGIMAAIGNDKALIEIDILDTNFKLWGSFAELIYKSVYINKQVSFRNRVLILFDWMKTQVFGRDLSQF